MTLVKSKVSESKVGDIESSYFSTAEMESVSSDSDDGMISIGSFSDVSSAHRSMTPFSSSSDSIGLRSPSLDCQSFERTIRESRPISMTTMCSYAPLTAIYFLSELKRQKGSSHAALEALQSPQHNRINTAVLFADISGFTGISEKLGDSRDGVDDLVRILNAYFGMLVKVASRHGGDVLKFAGDAAIVLWPPGNENAEHTARRAAQCALEIQRHLHCLELHDRNNEHAFELTLKIGIGVGEVTISSIGGVDNRFEFIATGEPLLQAFRCEALAESGQVMMSQNTHELVSPFFSFAATEATITALQENNCFVLLECIKPLRKRGIATTMQAKEMMMADANFLEQAVCPFLPKAVLPFLNSLEERWASEVRRVVVLFVSVGYKSTSNSNNPVSELSSLLMSHKELQTVLTVAQSSIHEYEGALNKFLLDDKGMTLLAVFGLPPLAHEDDALRGVLAAVELCRALNIEGFVPNIGVTTGEAFCGVTGGNTRREYSVLGAVVNLAARLMQHAVSKSRCIVTDHVTQYAAHAQIGFRTLSSVTLRGIAEPVPVFVPVHECSRVCFDEDLPTIDTVSHASIPQIIQASSCAIPTIETSRRRRLVPRFLLNLVRASSALVKGADEHLYVRDSIFNNERSAGSNESNTAAMLNAFKQPAFIGSKQGFLSRDRCIVTQKRVSWSKTVTCDKVAKLSKRSCSEQINSEICLATKKRFSLPENLFHDSSHLKADGRKEIVEASYPFMSAVTNVRVFIEKAHCFIDVNCAELLLIGDIKRTLQHELDEFQPDELKQYVLTSAISEVPLSDEMRLDVVAVFVNDMKPDSTMPGVIELRLMQMRRRQSWSDVMSTSSTTEKLNDFRMEEHAVIAAALNNLLQSGNMQCLLVQGEVGTGKTRLLSSLAYACPIMIACSTASALPGHSNLTFKRIVSALLSFHSARLVPSSSYTHNPNAHFVFDALQRLKMRHLAALLNPFISYRFQETSVTAAMRGPVRVQASIMLIVKLIVELTRAEPCAILIDDAQNMSQETVELLQKLMLMRSSIFIVLAARPRASVLEPILHFDGMDSLLLQPLSDNAIHEIACNSLGVSALPEKVKNLILKRSRGNALVAKEIVYFLRRNKLLNTIDENKINRPRRRRQSTPNDSDINDLKDISVLPNGRKRLTTCFAATDDEFNAKPLKVPLSLQNMLGALLDSLTQRQLILLKVAATIGDEFEGNLLRNAYPVDEGDSILHAEFTELLRLGIICRICEDEQNEEARKCNLNQHGKFQRQRLFSPRPSTIVDSNLTQSNSIDDLSATNKNEIAHTADTSSAVWNYVYTFSLIFLGQFVRSRLLRAQRVLLQSKLPLSVCESRKSRLSSTRLLHCGRLSVRKSPGRMRKRVWQAAFVAVHPTSLSIHLFKTKEVQVLMSSNPTKDEADIFDTLIPWKFMKLTALQVSLRRFSDSSGTTDNDDDTNHSDIPSFVMSIHASDWLSKGVKRSGKLKLELIGSSRTDVRKWMYFLGLPKVLASKAVESNDDPIIPSHQDEETLDNIINESEDQIIASSSTTSNEALSGRSHRHTRLRSIFNTMRRSSPLPRRSSS